MRVMTATLTRGTRSVGNHSSTSSPSATAASRIGASQNPGTASRITALTSSRCRRVDARAAHHPMAKNQKK